MGPENIGLKLEGPTEISYGQTGTFTASTLTSVDSYSWYLDGTLLSGRDSSSVSLGSDLAYGSHRLVVVARSGQYPFSAEAVFVIRQAA
jgi:hypothetical protein